MAAKYHKRDYTMVADALENAGAEAKTGGEMGLLQDIIIEFTIIFERDNRLFQAEKFIRRAAGNNLTERRIKEILYELEHGAGEDYDDI